MYMLRTALAAIVLVVIAGTTAEARPTSHQQAASSDWVAAAFHSTGSHAERASHATRSARHQRRTTAGNHKLGGRPGKWCGWYMRTRHGGGPEMNVAWNWRRYGSAASPQVGAIVVWRHHVGEIVGQASNGKWIVLSGNDGGRVRQRPRSIAGAVVRM